MTAPEAAKAVTIVTQTRVSPGKDDAFAKWQQRVGATVAKQAGFVKETVMPPSPPTQVDWVILQRFASSDAATAWLRSGERQRLVAEAQPILVGQDDVHLVVDDGGAVCPGALINSNAISWAMGRPFSTNVQANGRGGGCCRAERTCAQRNCIDEPESFGRALVRPLGGHGAAGLATTRQDPRKRRPRT